jgi:biotin carboxyl carrier protein
MADRAITSPVQGTVVRVDVTVDDVVHEGQQLAVVESMKMEYVIAADSDGAVVSVDAAEGDTVKAG